MTTGTYLAQKCVYKNNSQLKKKMTNEAKTMCLEENNSLPPAPPADARTRDPNDKVKQVIEDNLEQCRNSAAMQGRSMGTPYFNPKVSLEDRAEITRQMAAMYRTPGYFDPV